MLLTQMQTECMVHGSSSIGRSRGSKVLGGSFQGSPNSGQHFVQRLMRLHHRCTLNQGGLGLRTTHITSLRLVQKGLHGCGWQEVLQIAFFLRTIPQSQAASERTGWQLRDLEGGGSLLFHDKTTCNLTGGGRWRLQPENGATAALLRESGPPMTQAQSFVDEAVKLWACARPRRLQCGVKGKQTGKDKWALLHATDQGQEVLQQDLDQIQIHLLVNLCTWWTPCRNGTGRLLLPPPPPRYEGTVTFCFANSLGR